MRKKLPSVVAGKKVTGLQSALGHLEAPPSAGFKSSDDEIASGIHKALTASWVPTEKLQIKVDHGVVTLDGILHWRFQKQAAEKCITNIAGVRQIEDHILVRPQTHNEVEKKHIENALKMNWAMNGQDVRITLAGRIVTLNGVVNSYFQKAEAERIVSEAPGVDVVVNQLAIDLKD
jgi:osmotically-inducible protein OsmY